MRHTINAFASLGVSLMGIDVAVVIVKVLRAIARVGPTHNDIFYVTLFGVAQPGWRKKAALLAVVMLAHQSFGLFSPSYPVLQVLSE